MLKTMSLRFSSKRRGTKSAGPHGFIEDFSYCKSMGANDPGISQIGPGDIIVKIYVNIATD